MPSPDGLLLPRATSPPPPVPGGQTPHTARVDLWRFRTHISFKIQRPNTCSLKVVEFYLVHCSFELPGFWGRSVGQLLTFEAIFPQFLSGWDGWGGRVGGEGTQSQWKKRLSFHSMAFDTPARLIKQVAGPANPGADSALTPLPFHLGPQLFNSRLRRRDGRVDLLNTPSWNCCA